MVSNTTFATASRVMALAIEIAEKKQQLGDRVSESREYTEAVLEYAEIHARVFLNICSEKEIGELIGNIPDLPLTTELYRKRGATSLAKISSIKQK